MDPDQHDDDDGAGRAGWTALREAMQPLQAPASVEQALLLAYAQVHKRQSWHRRWYLRWRGSRSLAYSPALAAIAACCLALALLPPSLPGHAPLQAGAVAGQAASVLQPGSEFIALESAERIRSDPNPHLVGASLSRSVLAQMGLPVAPDAGDEQVRAELLVGADGAPLALRLALN